MSNHIAQTFLEVDWKLLVETGLFSALISGFVSFRYWEHLAKGRRKNLLLLAYSETVKAYERVVSLYIGLWPRVGQKPEYTKTSLFIFTDYSLLADLINSLAKADPELFEALLYMRERFFHVSRQLEASAVKVHELEALIVLEERTPDTGLRGRIKAMTNEVALLQHTAWAFVSEAPSIFINPPTPQIGDKTFNAITEKMRIIGDRVRKELPRSPQVSVLHEAFENAFQRKKDHDEYIHSNSNEFKTTVESVTDELFGDKVLPHKNLTKM